VTSLVHSTGVKNVIIPLEACVMLRAELGDGMVVRDVYHDLHCPAARAKGSEVVRQATETATAATEGETHAESLSVTTLRPQMMPYMPAHRHLLV
jgi:hypothetical protein